jgi:hypothetical protein
MGVRLARDWRRGPGVRQPSAMPAFGYARVYLTLPTLWGRVRLSMFNDFGLRPAKSPRVPERGLFRFRSFD